MTVGQLLRDLDTYGGGVDELIEWQAYASIEPFGYPMENYRAGVVAATVQNCAPRLRRTKAAQPGDFFPASNSRSGLTSRQQQQLEERRLKKQKRGG